MLCCAQPCQCVLSQLVADPHSRSIAPNRSKSTKVRVALTTGFWPHKSGAPNASVFNGVYICEIELSPQSCARFADLMFQSAPASSFFYISKCKSSSQQFCALFANNFPRSSRGTAETETYPSATPGATLPKKTQGFAPESGFTCEFTRFRTVTLPNYLIMGGWHDDVVDLMMRLTCGNASHDSRP